MKMAVIGLLAVLVLGGGAAGAYFYFAKPAEASLGAADEAAKAEHDAKAAEAAQAAVATQEFVHIDPLIFPVIGETGVTQTISLVVSIEVPSKEAAVEVERLSPRLKDAFIQDMYGALNRKNSMEKGVLKVGPLKARLNRISTQVLGEDKVNDVLLQIVSQRPI